MHRPPPLVVLGNRGSARPVFVWFFVAASILVTVATKLYRDGASDIGYIVLMSVAAVIALAIVAPKRFTSMRGATRDWEDDEPYGPFARHGESDANIGQSADSTANQNSKSDAA